MSSRIVLFSGGILVFSLAFRRCTTPCSSYDTIQLSPTPFAIAPLAFRRCTMTRSSSEADHSKFLINLFRSGMASKPCSCTSLFRIVARYLMFLINSCGRLASTEEIFSCNPLPLAPSSASRICSSSLEERIASSKSFVECEYFDPEAPIFVLLLCSVDTTSTWYFP